MANIVSCANFNTLHPNETLVSNGGNVCGPGAPYLATKYFQDVPFVGDTRFYAAIMQGDGNFVVYKIVTNAFGNQNMKPLWATKTPWDGQAAHGSPRGPYTLHLEADGTFRVVDANGKELVRRAPMRPAKKTPCRMIMQDDDNLVIYDAADQWVFSAHDDPGGLV